ncbi:IcmT/TraK family protein [Amorphus sp. 3PC139-8]|uniref:IcmT/TraK family protein n=1 Tax=Amorphus sp. 3PC139-8 TaxID=2735676 RepID=UPI00345CAD23
MYGSNLFWRETMRPARFLIFDARIVVFIAALVLYLRLSTLILFLLAAGVFRIVETRGYDFPNAIRKARSLVAGRFRSARRLSDRRASVDFGAEILLDRGRYRQARSAHRKKGEGSPTRDRRRVKIGAET